MDLNDKFMKACRNGNFNVVKECLAQGADIHMNNDQALRYAAYYGHLKVVKLLIENGANVHTWNDQALRYAAYYGNFETVKLLVENGADIHVEYDYALRWAAEKRHLQVVNYLRQVVGPAYKCYKCLIKSTCLELCEGFNNELKSVEKPIEIPVMKMRIRKGS